MNKFTKSLSIYLLPVLGLIFNSCIDEPVYPDGNIIAGTLYDSDGLVLYDLSDIYYVSPGNYPISHFSPERFSINAFTSPYDLVVNTEFGDYVFKVMGLNSKSLNLVYDDPEYNNSNNFPFFFYINVPPSESDETVYFYKFISEENNVQQTGYFNLSYGDSIGFCRIELPFNQLAFTPGKLVIFEAQNWFKGDNINFKNFGYKEIDTLRESVIITFTKEELGYDIPETISHFKNIAPNGFTGGGNSIKLCFPPYYKQNELTLYNDVPDDIYITMPLLPVDYKIKFTGSYTSGGPWERPFKFIYLEPGENGMIIHKQPLYLVDPPDMDTNINSSTVFRINDLEQGGIYMYEFIQISNISLSKKLRVFTKNKELTFSDIFCRGFEYKQNALYYWYVYKYPEFSGIDEFANSPYTINIKYNSTQASTLRRFYTR